MSNVFTKKITKRTVFCLAMIAIFLIPIRLQAQLASGYRNFLGNIYYKGQTPANFDRYWNQVTPENAGKWASCEQARDDMNYWLWLDRAYEYAKTNGFVFKEHCLVWGHSSGQPGWVCNLSASEQRAEVEEWIQALGERYPDMDLIDVVNEPLHAPPCYKDAIGGDGSTGWDWVIWSFEKARQYCHGDLLINDYGILNSSSNTNNYLGIINLLKDRNLIDGIGVQGHGLESTSVATIRNNLDALAETGLPVYVSEYEVDSSDDNQQRTIYQEQFPVFWEHPSVKGVTLWGYIQEEIWKANAYLVTSGESERPALQWLRSYLQGGGATPGPTPAPTQVPSALFVESGGQVVMEAEHYTDYFPGTGDFSHYAWVEDTSMSDASGGIHMFASPNEGGYALEETESPRMGYFVDFSTSESYYVWIRRAAGGGGDDSCQISIDAGGVIQWSYGGSSSFEWIKYDSTFSISSGAHIFKVGMREDGARVDKIILTTNSGYTPSGQGPAESQMTGSPSTQPPINPPAVTNPPTNPPTVTPGDTNSDGGVTIVDALLTAQYYVGLNPSNFNPSAADVNCSGSIDIVDALLIAQYYVGLINEFPC